VPAALSLQVEDQEAHSQHQPNQEEQAADGEEHSQGPVHGVRTEDGCRGMLEVVPGAGHQARGAFGGIGAHGHRNNPGFPVACLN